jgi:hypothetical protein
MCYHIFVSVFEKPKSQQEGSYISVKKTIKSKRYNTATAKTLYRWTNGANPDEHSYREESLCVGTRNKVIFLYTSTGVKGQSEEQRIIPLTRESAIEWLRIHVPSAGVIPNTIDEVLLELDSFILSIDSRKRTFSIAPAAWELLEKESEAANCSMSSLVNFAVLKTYGKDE